MFYRMTGYDKRNWVKLKVFYYLQILKDRGSKWATVSDIQRHTRCQSEGSLRILLKRWYSWGFVVEGLKRDGNILVYRIAPRGTAYLKKAADYYPHMSKVWGEVRTAMAIRIGVLIDGRYHIIKTPFASEDDYFVSLESSAYGIRVKSLTNLFSAAEGFCHMQIGQPFRKYVLGEIGKSQKGG